ncbi:MAG: hypothetical protein AAGN35_13695 [Bacteroidota bacterium]
MADTITYRYTTGDLILTFVATVDYSKCTGDPRESFECPRVTVEIRCNRGSFCTSPPPETRFVLDNSGTPTHFSIFGVPEICQVSGKMNIVFLSHSILDRGIHVFVDYAEEYERNFQGLIVLYPSTDPHR